jgi:hypothetical protein
VTWGPSSIAERRRVWPRATCGFTGLSCSSIAKIAGIVILVRAG